MVPLLNMQQGQQQMTMAKVSISILVMALPVLYVSMLGVTPATLFRDTTFWFLMSNSIIVVIAADSGMLFFGRSSSSYSVDGVVNDDRPFLVSSDVNDVSMVVHGDDDAVSGAMKSHAHALIVSGQEDVVVIVPETSETFDVTPSSAVACTAAQRARALTASKSLAREERAAARRQRSRSHSHALVASGGADPVQEKSVVFVREESKLRRTATERRHPPRPSSAEAEKESQYARLSDEELNRRVEDFITRFNREIRLQIEKDQQA